jgi:hypothetical protein
VERASYVCQASSAEIDYFATFRGVLVGSSRERVFARQMPKISSVT